MMSSSLLIRDRRNVHSGVERMFVVVPVAVLDVGTKNASWRDENTRKWDSNVSNLFESGMEDVCLFRF